MTWKISQMHNFLYQNCRLPNKWEKWCYFYDSFYHYNCKWACTDISRFCQSAIRCTDVCTLHTSTHTHTHIHKGIGALNQYGIWQLSKLDFGIWLQGYIEFIQLHSIYIYLGIPSLSIPFCLLPPYPFFLIFPEHPGFSYILMAAVWSEWSKQNKKNVQMCQLMLNKYII